jgi:hypothetical protein
VIAVFTKYDQFRRDTEMKLEDERHDPEVDLDAEMERVFKQHYLAYLPESAPYICLEGEHFVNQLACTPLISCPVGMHKPGRRCNDLIEMTANALSGGVVAHMLLSVQKDNLELNIKRAVKL